METIGWLGGVLLAACGFPEAVRAIKNKKCELSWAFLTMWGLGEVFTFVYVTLDKFSLPLLFNYGFNILFITIMVCFKAFDRS